MACLVSKTYDPATAVTSKSTAAALAMTALDTTNLRATFTAPTSGRILVKMSGNVSGGTAAPSILFGLLNGASVFGPRVMPVPAMPPTIAAATLVNYWAEWVVEGLTPGATYNLDAAYGVETLVTSSAIKYGGPNNTTAADAYGAFVYEIWEA